jgi:uncharacterized membrane protein
MARRPVVLGVFTFVILAVAIVSVATGSWYWAVATEAVIVTWFTIALVMPRTWRNSVGDQSADSPTAGLPATDPHGRAFASRGS